jgi:chondroitin 4-sulfotransferase 11
MLAVCIRQFKILYYPIPKVACSSIKYCFAKMLGLICNPKTVHQVLPLTKIEANWKYLYENWFSFAFVRNPWDRIVSCYLDKVADKSFYCKGSLFEGFEKYDSIYYQMGFEEFIHAICQIPDEYSNDHFRSQHRFLPHIDELTYIGRFEKLQSDWVYINKETMINQSINYTNWTNRNHYSSYYNSDTKRMVENRYAVDISLFEYQYDE